LDGSVTGISRCLSISCCLRYTPDRRGSNSGASSPARQRMHAFTRCVSSLGTRRKLSGTTHGKSPARGLDVRSPHLQLLHAMNLPVHPFQGGGEYLLALQGMLGCPGEALSSRRPLSTRFKPLCARQCAFFVAHVAQTLAQGLEVIK